MKKWSLSLIIVTLLFCMTVKGLKSAPETEGIKTKSEAKLTELLKRIAKLEKRVVELEKRSAINAVPVTLTPQVPNTILKPVNPLPHKDWKRKQFNGLDYFIVPLNSSDQSPVRHAH